MMNFITIDGRYRFLELRVYSYSPVTFEYLLRSSPKDLDEWVQQCIQKHEQTPHTIACYSKPNDLIMDFRRHIGTMYGEVLGRVIADIWPAKKCLSIDHKGQLV